MNQHIIRQQKVEISSTDGKKSRELFTETSRLFNNRVKDVTGNIFDKFAGEDELIRIDTLELDMGYISFPFSEEDFVKAYADKLEKALSDLLEEQLKNEKTGEQKNQQITTKRSLVHLLEQFLLTGTIAWWANREELKDPVNVFTRLREKEIANLQSMIERVFSEAIVRKRLVYTFEEENVRTVIGFIQPSEEKFIFQYHTEISHLHNETRFVKAENVAFRKALWLFILDFLAEHSGSRFNRKMFVRSTLKSIADKFNISFEQILFFFSEAVKNIPEDFRKKENLFSLVEEISFDQLKEQITPEQVRLNDVFKSQNLQSIKTEHPLFFFLINGFFPFDFHGVSEELMSFDFINVMRENEPYTRLFFLKNGKSALVRKRLVTRFSEEAVKAVVRFAEPAGSDAIISYSLFIADFQKKTSFVKSEEKVFRQSFWDLILAYLFSERSSVFNAKMFLVSNIQALSQHYNMDYTHLLAILAQGVGQQSVVSGDQSGLFYLLTEILAENNELKKSKNQSHVAKVTEDRREMIKQHNEPLLIKELSLSEILDDARNESDVTRKSFILHLFLYLVEFGDLPWWAGVDKLSVTEVIRRMRKSYSKELRIGFLYAAKKGRVGVYFLEKYPSLFRTELIFLFENSLREKLVSFLHDLNALDFFKSSSFSSDALFAKSFVAALADSSNESPDLNIFFSNLFKGIEQIYGMEGKKNAAIEGRKFISVKGDKQLQEAFDDAVKEYSYVPPSLNIKYSDRNFEQVLQFSVSNTDAFAVSELTGYLSKWIIYYAKHRKLPDEIKQLSILRGEEFVAWMLEFLFRKDRNKLNELFSASELSAGEQLLLSGVLQGKGAELEVRFFLESHVQKLLLADDLISAGLEYDRPESWKFLIQQLVNKSLGSEQQTKWITLMKQESSRISVSYYFSNDEIRLLFEKAGRPELLVWYDIFYETFSALASDHFEQQQFGKWIMEFFLCLFSGQIKFQPSMNILSGQFVSFLLSKTKNNDYILYRRIRKLNEAGDITLSGNAKDLMNQLYISFNKVVLNLNTIKAIEEEIKFGEQKLHFHLKDKEKKMIQKELKEKSGIPENVEKNKSLPFGERIYIRNAGIVLLHPFLSTLFSRAGLTKEGAFTNEESQTRATLLLQYAVTDAERDWEHELMLNKILVGLQPEDVMVDTNYLREEEKELITGMIKAIILQWDKMKNTSIEGFRNSFLIREGYIFQKEDAWVLRVEQRAYDILLQTLPWSFGMIKFSWMTKPLIVEWT